MGVVWHGCYVKYLEDGRESFGDKYGLHYLDVYNAGLLTPIVKMNIDYKHPLYYGDKAIIETRYIDCEAAKILFEYSIFRVSNNELVATAETTQVFLDNKRELILTTPDFILEWKKKLKLL